AGERRARPPAEALAERDRRPLEEDPEAVPREIEGEDAAGEGRRRQERDPRGAEHLESTLGEDRAPLRRCEEEHLARAAQVVERDGRAAADDVAEEAELAEHEEDRARLERRADREHRQEVRDRMTRERRELREPFGARGFEERAAFEINEG